MPETYLDVTVEAPITLDVDVVSPINLDLSEGAPIYINVENTEPLFTVWKLLTFGSGPKQTGVDSGTLWQMSLDDDYLYICVTPGVIGVAVWKKMLLFQT